ncbi:MAG TPA: CFI-box-CTERM domain-containing protein [Kofleriaceae bacterium]
MPFSRALAIAVLTLGASGALADTASPGECHVVDVNFKLQNREDLVESKAMLPQVVVWVEKADGTYVDTLYITQQTGTYGLGNRPGRFDFNSARNWPYGRRITTFPVWAHKKTPLEFDTIRYQNSDENNLSHPFTQSSHEAHFCRPMTPMEADAVSCASPNAVFTDKGVRDASTRSNYPPRQDIVRAPGMDSVSVDGYNDMNPFDAISQATPAKDALVTSSWPIPDTLPMGDYVMWVEASTEFDHNDTYSATAYPAPTGIPWSEYGEPYRGQPSLVFKVPFNVGSAETVSSTATYAGYGDPTGETGAINPPDSTISTDLHGSGVQRLGLVSDTDGMWRVKVTARPEFDFVVPGDPAQFEVADMTSRSVTMSFLAPGDDGSVGKVKGYDIRYRVGDTPITADNFDAPDTLAIPGAPSAADPGTKQTFDIVGLLPETTYTVAIRALDDCHNTSEIKSTTFETPARSVGEVDACFIATAAYGSMMAADVGMLRHMRDSVLKKSVLGELAVEAYYTFSPPVAGVVGESDVLRSTARAMLLPIVRKVRAFSF